MTLGGGTSGTNAGFEGILVYTNHNGETNRTINLPAGSAGGFELTDATNTGASNLFGATLTLSGQVTGGGTLDKLESGNLVLSNTTNNYTGGSIVRGGILQFASSGALPSTGTITVDNGGTVAAAWNFGQSFLNQISPSSIGVLALASNNNSNLSFANLPGMSLGANNQAQSFLGTLTPNNSIYRLGGGGVSSSLMIQNAFTLTGTNSAVISNAGSAGGTVVFADAQNYSGSTTIGGNPYTVGVISVPSVTLILAGQNATIANSSAVNLNASGILRIVDSAAAAAKLNAAAPLNFSGGTLQYFNDGSSTNFAQSVGTMNVTRAQLRGRQCRRQRQLHGGPDCRRPGPHSWRHGRFRHHEYDHAADRSYGGRRPGRVGDVGQPGGFATSNGSNQVVQAAETTVTSLLGLSSSSTYYNTATTAIPSGFGSVSLNTLRTTNGAADTISMLASDTITANAFMTSSSVFNNALNIGNTPGVGTVSPQGSELFFFIGSNVGSTVNANINGPAANVVKSGANTLTLAGSGFNAYAGLVINQGAVAVSASAPCPPGPP